MEWVETTGRTVEEAKKSALEQLGVEEADTDFEVISEPKVGLFGRLKEEARVRARVRPRYPRSKGERRERRRGRGAGGADHASQSAPSRHRRPNRGWCRRTQEQVESRRGGASGRGRGPRSSPAEAFFAICGIR
jgi:spoIIIJ-associated protein